MVDGPIPRKDSSRQGLRDDDWYAATRKADGARAPWGRLVVLHPTRIAVVKDGKSMMESTI